MPALQAAAFQTAQVQIQVVLSGGRGKNKYGVMHFIQTKQPKKVLAKPKHQTTFARKVSPDQPISWRNANQTQFFTILSISRSSQLNSFISLLAPLTSAPSLANFSRLHH